MYTNGSLATTRREAQQDAGLGDQLRWFKSSRSGGNGGACVEVAFAAGTVGVRDSKEVTGGRHTGARLPFAPGAFAAFVADVKGGQYDLA